MPETPCGLLVGVGCHLALNQRDDLAVMPLTLSAVESASEAAKKATTNAIVLLHNGARESYWFRVYDRPEDLPSAIEDDPGDDAATRAGKEETRKVLELLNRGSLREHLKLQPQQYLNLIDNMDLMQVGSQVKVKKLKWSALFIPMKTVLISTRSHSNDFYQIIWLVPDCTT